MNKEGAFMPHILNKKIIPPAILNIPPPQPQMKVLRAPGGKHILATPVVYYLEAADLPEKPRDEKKRAQKVQRARKVQIVLIQTKNTY